MTSESETTKWRYFGRDAMGVKVFEIYRCPANGKRIQFQRHEDVQLLLKDGSWRPNMQRVLVDEIHSGKFDEKIDEISEEEAMEYYKTWLATEWPGRP